MPRSLEGFDCEKCHKEGKDHQHLCHIQESSLPLFLANIVERNRILCLFFVQIFFADEGIYNGCYMAWILSRFCMTVLLGVGHSTFICFQTWLCYLTPLEWPMYGWEEGQVSLLRLWLSFGECVAIFWGVCSCVIWNLDLKFVICFIRSSRTLNERIRILFYYLFIFIFIYLLLLFFL